VLGAFVDEVLVIDLVGLERRLVGRPAGQDAFVLAGVVDHQRRADLRHSAAGGWLP
jgi:hypothetical protein